MKKLIVKKLHIYFGHFKKSTHNIIYIDYLTLINN